jgi:hypothetical protein
MIVFDNSLIQHIIDEYVQYDVPVNRFIVCENLAGETGKVSLKYRPTLLLRFLNIYKKINNVNVKLEV